MSKSCDNLILLDEKISYGAENPGIFTDAYCYLPWIAETYGMSLADGYTRPSSCDQPQGDKRNIDLADCLGRYTQLGRYTENVEFEKCDFSYVEANGRKWDQCMCRVEILVGKQFGE